MSDTPPGEGQGDGGGEGGGEGAGDGGAADWRAGLPPELAENPILKPYATLPDALNGFLETKRLVGMEKVAIPKDDADEAGWSNAFKALGRPDDPTGYEIPVPDGVPTDYAEAFRPVAHKLGLSARQAKGLAEWQNETMATAQQAMLDAGKAEIEALKGEMGADFAPKLAAGKAAAKAFGVSDAIADQLDEKLGSRALVELFMNIGAKMGEHGRIDGDPAAGSGGQDPKAERQTLLQDKAFRDKLDAGDPEAKARWSRINAAIAAAQG